MKNILICVVLSLLLGCTMITRKYELSQGNTKGYITEDGTALPPINIMVLNLTADVDTKTSAEQAIDTELVAAWRAAQAAATREGYTNIADIYNKLIEGKLPKSPTTPTPTPAPATPAATTPATTPAATTPATAPAATTPATAPLLDTTLEFEFVEEARFHGISDENGRPIFYFSKNMAEYPEVFRVNIDGCGTLNITGNDGTRIDFDKNFNRVEQQLGSGLGGTFIRQSLVTSDPRGMVLVSSKECKSTKAFLLTPKKPVVISNNPPSKVPGPFTLPLRQLHDESKMFNWLEIKGSDLIGPIQIVTGGCGTFLIPDPTVKWAENGDIDNHDQAVYFPGNWGNWPGQDTHPLGFASFITARGCYKEGTSRDMTITQGVK